MSLKLLVMQRRSIKNDYFSSDDLGRKLKETMPKRCGSENLLQVLSSMLQGMINVQVPEMKSKLEGLLKETSDAIDDLGASVSKDKSIESLSKITQKYSDSVRDNALTNRRTKASGSAV